MKGVDGESDGSEKVEEMRNADRAMRR